jgi:NADPH-dependent 2,4-dienoyl-CoA reductase/sulfur reductase-like enzyme
MNSIEYDIIIIGAGPAGMSAAALADHHKASVLVLDENCAPGGQIYRAIEKNQKEGNACLGQSYQYGLPLVDNFRRSYVHYQHSATVWYLSSAKVVHYSVNGKAHSAKGRKILVATGAQERPFPLLGWTLNGVMSAGAAQILLKESGVVCEDAVFVGTGPLLYLIAHQYISAGIPIKAIIDTTPIGNYLRAMRYSFGALKNAKSILQGWRWKREIIKSGTLYISNIGDVRINGSDSVTGVEYCQKGKWKNLNCKHVFLHQGVVPELNTSLSAGCDKGWNERQACWTIDVDQYGQSSVEGISVAGDASSIAGGVAAAQRGSIAALNMLYTLNLISSSDREVLSKPFKKKLSKEMNARPFIDALFKPHLRYRVPQDSRTIVCRCEEVTLAQIKESISVGCKGPSQLKSFTRCGMGPCQGRLCGLSVTEILTKELGVREEQVGYYNIRPPIKPVTLAELASLDGS